MLKTKQKLTVTLATALVSSYFNKQCFPSKTNYMLHESSRNIRNTANFQINSWAFLIDPIFFYIAAFL